MNLSVEAADLEGCSLTACSVPRRPTVKAFITYCNSSVKILTEAENRNFTSNSIFFSRTSVMLKMVLRISVTYFTSSLSKDGLPEKAKSKASIRKIKPSLDLTTCLHGKESHVAVH